MLRLIPQELSIETLDERTLKLSFGLPKGCLQQLYCANWSIILTPAHASEKKRITQMKILLSNDDGVNAKGIAVLYQALTQIAEVTLVAPDRNCSGASNSLTLMNPLRATTLDNGFMSVNGTPTDCVHLGVNQLVDEKPDLVVAGINHGGNLGDDTLYSGTVAAATEGRHLGLPAIAVSLCSHHGEHFETAAAVTVNIIKGLASHPLPKDQIININVPRYSAL